MIMLFKSRTIFRKYWVCEQRITFYWNLRCRFKEFIFLCSERIIRRIGSYYKGVFGDSYSPVGSTRWAGVREGTQESVHLVAAVNTEETSGNAGGQETKCKSKTTTRHWPSWTRNCKYMRIDEAIKRHCSKGQKMWLANKIIWNVLYFNILHVIVVFDHSHTIPRKPGSSNHRSTTDLY